MGKLTLKYFGPVVWETMLPETYKDITDLEKFKTDIKEWISVNAGYVKHTLLGQVSLRFLGNPISEQLG